MNGVHGNHEFIVIFQQVVGSDLSIEYSWDGQRFQTRRSAIKHGLRTRGSDDFNIGELYHGELFRFTWMEKPLDYDLEEIAGGIGLKVCEL